MFVEVVTVADAVLLNSTIIVVAVAKADAVAEAVAVAVLTGSTIVAVAVAVADVIQRQLLRWICSNNFGKILYVLFRTN